MTDHYFDCPKCRKAFHLKGTDNMACPHCGHDFSPYPKGSTAGLMPDVPPEVEDTLGEELRDTFLELMPKLVRGKKDYGDESLELPLGALLDEIDDVLEENAEEFVKNYVQRGGA